MLNQSSLVSVEQKLHFSVGMETKLYAMEVVMKVLEANGTPRFLGRYPPPIQRRSASLPRIDEWKPPHPHPLRCYPMESASPSTSERQVLAGSYYDQRNVWQTPHPLRSNPTRSHIPMRFEAVEEKNIPRASERSAIKMGWSRRSPKKEGSNVKLPQCCLRSQNSAFCAPGLLQIMQMKQKDGCGGQKQSGQEEATTLGREHAPVPSILVQAEGRSSHFSQSLTSLHRIPTPNRVFQHLITHLQQTHHRQ